MKFGSVPVGQAEGAILAHTLRLRERVVLKKGKSLGRDDLEALRQAGHDSVIAALLEPDDVGEDEAAARVVQAAAGPNLRREPAATGRANLHADVHGLLLVDRARVEAMNAIHESITLATLAPWSVVQPGELVATLKVIPFAVHRTLVDACVSALEQDNPTPAGRGGAQRRGGPANTPLHVAPFTSHRAGLILTRLPRVPESLLDRAAATQRERLAALGSALAFEIRCDHDEAALTAALAAMIDRGADPVLVLGASAIIDRQDVVPAGLVAAGGRIEHLGMPVDPGNLLLLGGIGTTPVIGVPGCARSLRPSGFDWVLQRVLAGVAVTARDVMSMGVGGLLKDVPGRPSPREPVAELARPRIAAVLLAAGQSRRMGETNKLLVDIDGTPMVARAADALLASRARPVVVVTGHERERVEAALAGRDVVLTHNPHHAAGMSTSLRAGLAALPEEVDGALICLGDMPWVRPEHVEALLTAFDPAKGAAVCIPVHDRKRGNPVLWARRFFPQMTALQGDVGARQLLVEHAESVVEVPVSDGGVTVDIDTPDALENLRKS